MIDMTRRDFLTASLAGSAVLGLAGTTGSVAVAVDFTKPVPEASRLSAYQNGPLVILRWHDMPFLTYRAHATQKYPYFYPLTGPLSGMPLVAESALPYP
ncbi:MAG: twin-arginine translocation signal domain-containing protein, partial [Planctomycetaceae bacterium]